MRDGVVITPFDKLEEHVIVDIGRSDVALDVLAKRGDWDRLWEVAAKEKMATSTMAKFIIMRVEEVRTFCIRF